MTEQEPTTPPLPSRLSRLTTPTWEIEMLLSGAVVFALFQAPEPLRRWSELASGRTGEAGDLLLQLVTIYALVVNYALIAMFLIHLCSRAYWVALVGLDSVFPAGVRWENFRQGPIARREMQRLIPSLPVLVERADNFSSLCFSFGLLTVMWAVIGSLYALPTAVLALVITELLFDGEHLQTVLLVVLCLVLLPLVLAELIDRLDARWHFVPADGLIGRAIARVLSMQVNALPAPLLLTLSTNLRSRRTYGPLIGASAVMFAIIFVQMPGAPRLRLDGYDYLPADVAGLAVDMRHYRDQRRDDDFDLRSPTIDSMLPEGRYLRLVLPYRPELHGPLVEQRCVPDGSDAAALATLLAGDAGSERRAAEVALISCLAQALDLRLDGVPVAADSLAFSSDPDSGLRGLLAVLPIAQLPAGRHEITLQQPLRVGDRDDEKEIERHAARGPERIAFWR